MLELALDKHMLNIYLRDRCPSRDRKQSAKAKRGASATSARRTANRGGGGGGSRTPTEKVDGVGKVMTGLKGDLAADVETVLEKLEAECGAFGERSKPSLNYCSCERYRTFVSVGFPPCRCL